MQALETYPPFNRNREKSSEDQESNDEYVHVKQYNSPKKGRKCGTLSKSEWEAACKFSFLSLITLHCYNVDKRIQKNVH